MEQVAKRANRKRNRNWGAFTIPVFARWNRMPEGMVRRAVKNGDIESSFARWAGADFKSRIRIAMGLLPLPDDLDDGDQVATEDRLCARSPPIASQ